MNTAVILVLLALLALLFLVRVARRRAQTAQIVNVADLTQQICSVDIEAFRNLVDPAEAEYLRSHLSPSEFRRVQRQRLRAAVVYIHSASRNAVLLAHVGEMARQSPEASVALAGARLQESATQLRVFALQATGKLYLGVAFPSLHLSAGKLPDTYARLASMSMMLGRLQSASSRSPAA